MALTKNIVAQNGLSAPNSYIKVHRVTITEKTNAVCDLVFSLAKDATPYQIDSRSFEYALDGENAIKQAYQELKKMPEFDGAADC
jgi:hypothetical protein